MKHASSTSGEVNAIQQAIQDVDDILYLASILGVTANIRTLTDSMSGIQQIENGGHSIKDKERATYIKQMILALPFPSDGLNHVSGLIQMADPLTKVKALNWYGRTTNMIY